MFMFISIGLFIYFDMECENSHSTNQESAMLQTMWFGEFVAHFSSENVYIA